MNDSVDKPKQQNIENESFGKMLVRLGAPICIANIITIFTTVLTNDIYSANVGQNGFSIMGALAMALTVGNSITGSVALAAWIKGAPCYGNRSGETASRQCRDAVWALLLLSVSIIAIMLLAQEYVFQLMNVPADIWDDAK